MIVCCATGPSISRQQVEAARRKGFRLFVCNSAYQLAHDAELLYAVNLAFWDHYWPMIKGLPCEKWTTTRAAADRYGINWIAERNAPGLSGDPSVVHHGHGSGYTLVSMAARAGAKRIALLGYDLKYAPDYDGLARRCGSTPRHSLELLAGGEYPATMQHWPSVQVREGVHVGLVSLYKSVRDQGLVELINATPNSALEQVLGYTPIGDIQC